MLLLSLLELAFGQLFFSDMLVCVRVPVWGFSSCLIDGTVITSGLLLSHACLVFVRASLRPALFQSHACLCLCACLGLLLLSD